MYSVDPALEKRVWSRVYGRETVQGGDIRLRQLCATARDCALLCGALRGEVGPEAARRLGLMEKEMNGAAKALSEAAGDISLPPPTGCPGCDRERKLWLLKLWLEEWAGGCRELAGRSSHRKLLEKLADMGRRHGAILKTVYPARGR